MSCQSVSYELSKDFIPCTPKSDIFNFSEKKSTWLTVEYDNFSIKLFFSAIVKFNNLSATMESSVFHFFSKQINTESYINNRIENIKKEFLQEIDDAVPSKIAEENLRNFCRRYKFKELPEISLLDDGSFYLRVIVKSLKFVAWFFKDNSLQYLFNEGNDFIEDKTSLSFFNRIYTNTLKKEFCSMRELDDEHHYVRYCSSRHINNGNILPSAFLLRNDRDEDFLSGVWYDFFQGNQTIVYKEIKKYLTESKGLRLQQKGVLSSHLVYDVTSIPDEEIKYSVKQITDDDPHAGIFPSIRSLYRSEKISETVKSTIKICDI